MTLNFNNKREDKKANKSFLVLLLFRLLEKGERVVKADFASEYHLSLRSFDRYIAEIRCYLLEQEPYLELRYRYLDGSYCLAKPRP